jgi:hypothetical protein
VYVRSTAADTLWLRPAGGWVRHAWLDERGLIADSGHWTRDEVDGAPALAFEQFSFHRVLPREVSRAVAAAFGKPGFWLVQPKRTLTGVIELEIDPDVDDAFVRVRSD